MRKTTCLAVLAALTLFGYAPQSKITELPLNTQNQPKPLEELDYLALTIWAEARGEGMQGMTQVGHVIRNRVEKGCFGGCTYRGVVTKPKQFSCWNPGDPNVKKLTLEYTGSLSSSTPDGKALIMAYAAARSVMSRKFDPTQGATHYHTVKVNPSWAKSLRKIATLGHHVFYA